MRLIGHLDVARALRRAVTRAGIEVVYSRGFTPRLRLSFGPPLPLGWTSECEYFDIKLARRCPAESIREDLQLHLPEGLSVEEVEILEGTPVSLSAAFPAAEYEVEVPDGWCVAREWRGQPGRGQAFSGEETKESNDVVVRVGWQESAGGKRVVSVVLGQKTSDNVRVKDSIARLLGVGPEDLQGVRIHKRRVYSEGEQPRGTQPGQGK